MAEEQGGGLSKFVTWVGGIVSAVLITVLGAVLVRHFTEPVVAPTYSPIGLTGVVSDGVTSAPIVDAQVTAASGTTLASVKTDNEGRYSFVLAGTALGTQSVTVDIVASGYAFYRSAALTVTAGDNYVPLPLSRTAVASGGAPPVAAGPVGVGPVSRITPQIYKVFPANFRKPATTVQLIPK